MPAIPPLPLESRLCLGRLGVVLTMQAFDLFNDRLAVLDFVCCVPLKPQQPARLHSVMPVVLQRGEQLFLSPMRLRAAAMSRLALSGIRARRSNSAARVRAPSV